MPDFISDMKLASLVNVEKEEVVSLVELLLGEQAEIYNKEKERAKNTSTPGVKVKSRRERRRSGRSAKTKNKQTSKTGSSVQKMEQLRVVKQRQEKRKQALLKYQLQEGQRKTTPTSGQAGDSAASKRADKKKAEKASNSIEINPALRPTILGLIDFRPVFDSEKNVTSTGNAIKAKRAARALRVENLLDIDTSKELIGELDWLAAHTSNLTQQQTFLDAVSVTNIEMYEEALSALELDPASVGSASNTEVLYTFIRDYCYSLTTCSPRVLEETTREFESGTKLVKYSSSSNKVRQALKNSNWCIGGLYSILSEDNEISLRHLLATVSREMLLSYNKTKNDVGDVDDNIYPRNIGRSSSGYSFCSYFNVNPRQKSMAPRRNAITDANPFGVYNMHGVLYPATVDNQKVRVYPYEQSELVAATNYKSADSAPDQIKKLYSTIDPTAGLGPYSNISSRWSDAKEIVDSLLEIDELEFSTSPGASVLELICRNIVLNCLEKLPESSSKSVTKTDAIQIAWLCAAGRDEETWKWLFLFLAFLQDQLTGVVMTGEQLDLSALSHVVKRDTTLINLLGKPHSKSTKLHFFDVPESKISLSPQPSGDDWTNPKTIDAMQVQQEIDVADGEDASTDSSLQSFFGLSWEEVCDKCTMAIRKKLSTSTDSAGSDDESDTTSVKLDDIKDSLMALSTSGESIFSSLLTLQDDANFLFLNGSFNEAALSTFTQIPANRIHGALILTAAKVASCYIDDLTHTTGATSAMYETDMNKRLSGVPPSSISIGAMKLIGPRSPPSWTTASDAEADSSGQSIQFSYSKVSEVKEALQTFLDSEENDYSLLEEASSIVSRSFSAMDEEYDFAFGFISSLEKYFANVRDSYSAIVQSMTSDIDLETDGTQTLNERIKEGLPMSTDMCKMLLNYIRVYDSSDSTYRDIRTRDKALICSNMTLMSSILQEEDYCEPDQLKYIVVGIPAGLLDMTKQEPVDLDDVDREISQPSTRDFSISIEKVDLTRPDLEYVDKEYSFSRNLFINKIDDSTEGELTINFDSINKDFSITEETESSLSSETFTDEQINNLKNDFALKLYSDILLDLDFFPDAYPNGTTQRKDVLTGSISMPSLSAVNKDSDSFLSGSNIAFDTDDRKIEAFSFYTEGTETLNMNLFKGLDPVAYSVYSYLNSYGTVAAASAKKDSLKYGTIFERILAIPFNPSTFEIETQSEEETSGEVNAKNDKLSEAESEVGIGLETSQGVELANYRVYITIPDSGNEESD
jgi:hypothetical protein